MRNTHIIMGSKDGGTTNKGGKMETCYSFESWHPDWNGEPSTTCIGCSNRNPIDETLGYILLDGKVNCNNYDPNFPTDPFIEP